MRIVIVLLAILLATPALAGPGLDLYGLAYYPDEPEDRVLNTELLGLGLQFDLRVREASRLYVEGGVFDDVYENANVHVGLGYRHRVIGPLHAGGGLYLMRTESLNGGDPVLAPVPQLTLAGGPGELTFQWTPELDGLAAHEAFSAYATLFPFGRTAPGDGLADRGPARSAALEFAFTPNYGFDDLRGMQAVWRSVEPGVGGVRLGGRIDLDKRKRTSPTLDERADDYSVSVLVERIRYLRADGPLRAYTALGPALGFDTYTATSSNPESGYEQSRRRNTWSAALRCGVGVEWTVTEGIAFTAETGWRGGYAEERDSYADGPALESEYWFIEGTGVQTGVVLYFD